MTLWEYLTAPTLTHAASKSSISAQVRPTGARPHIHTAAFAACHLQRPDLRQRIPASGRRSLRSPDEQAQLASVPHVSLVRAADTACSPESINSLVCLKSKMPPESRLGSQVMCVTITCAGS